MIMQVDKYNLSAILKLYGIYPVHTTIRVDNRVDGLKQMERDSSQSKLSVHTTEFNLDRKIWKQ